MKIITLATAFAAFVVLGAGTGEGKTVRGSCPAATAMEYFVSTDVITVGAGHGRTMAEESFTQGGTGPGCAVVTFVAVTDASAADSENPASVRAELDHDTIAIGGRSFWLNSESKLRVTFVFIFPDVVPGPHVITLLSQGTPFNGADVTERTVLINHTP